MGHYYPRPLKLVVPGEQDPIWVKVSAATDGEIDQNSAQREIDAVVRRVVKATSLTPAPVVVQTFVIEVVDGTVEFLPWRPIESYPTPRKMTVAEFNDRWAAIKRTV